MRVYRRVGRRSGVMSMGLGTYLVVWVVLICGILGALQALGHWASANGTVIGLIFLAVGVGCFVRLVVVIRRETR